MQTRRNGILTLRRGRRTLDGIHVENGAAVQNDAEMYTYATRSEGEILGTGTLWAHVSSRPVGGTVAALHTVIYYGEQYVTQRYIQIMSGSFTVSSPSGDGSIVS